MRQAGAGSAWPLLRLAGMPRLARGTVAALLLSTPECGNHDVRACPGSVPHVLVNRPAPSTWLDFKQGGTRLLPGLTWAFCFHLLLLLSAHTLPVHCLIC